MPISIIVNFLWTRLALGDKQFLTSLLVILHELYSQSGVIVMLYCLGPLSQCSEHSAGERKKQTHLSGDLEQTESEEKDRIMNLIFYRSSPDQYPVVCAGLSEGLETN